MPTIREHEFPPDATDETKCQHCGDPKKLSGYRSCIGREVPRATPPSIFAGDMTHIGERAKEIRAAEDAAWQAAPQ